MGQSVCSCKVAVPRRESAGMLDPLSGYAIRLDEIQDDTRFDPGCPFHGDHGSMVLWFGRPGGRS